MMYMEIKNRNITYEGKFYRLYSPRDENLSARDEYRILIKREFDLVLVENGYPLEPNYVLIDGVPVSFNEEEIKKIN